MFDPSGLVSVALGSVVLDRPDRTGRYFAKDLAGGWAYLVGDAAGDQRFRGQGVCEGGLDTTLRCAFLAALHHVPEYARIRVLVENRQAHRMMVQLAKRDPHVVAAIAGRLVWVLTQPEERSLYQVRSAAERAASTALRDREHAEFHAAEAERNDPVPDASADAPDGEPGMMQDWLARRRAASPRRPDQAAQVAVPAAGTAPAGMVASAAARWLVGPLVEGARSLAGAGLAQATTARSSRPVSRWLQEFDKNVAAVASDLHDVEA
ncbi:MAG TPA: hypothetical protein VFG12_05640 [Rhodopila sp.]|nr:hypothetical protein [Rhodopila sp.]